MDLKILRTNRVIYQFDSQTAAVLLEAFPEIFARADKQATPVPAARSRWWVSKSVYTGTTVLNVKCDACQRHECYSGRGEDILKFQKSLCIHTDPCPEAIREQYTAEFSGTPSLGSEFWKTALAKEPERPQ